jgi:hypothetical protein
MDVEVGPDSSDCGASQGERSGLKPDDEVLISIGSVKSVSDELSCQVSSGDEKPFLRLSIQLGDVHE